MVLLDGLAVFTESFLRLQPVELRQLVLRLLREFVDFLVNGLELVEDRKIIQTRDAIAVEGILVKQHELSLRLRLSEKGGSGSFRNIC